MVKGAVAVATIMAAGIACPAAAQGRDDSGLYLGGSVGMSQYKDVCKHSSVPCDDTDIAFRVFAGYQFNRNWQLRSAAAISARRRARAPPARSDGSRTPGT